MSAIGELIVLIIYLILCVPPIWIILLLILRGKKFRTKGITYLLIGLIPLTVFSYNQYSNHKDAEIKFVGFYYLTEYPDCNPCKLNLKENNTFTVYNGKEEIERGKWKYRSGGDYWIVDIGKYGQLGSGKYKYELSENNFKN